MGYNLNLLGIYGRAMNMNSRFYSKFENKIKPRILKDNKFAKARYKKKKPKIQNHKNLGKVERHKLILEIE
jgi:hypothetical protein